MSPIISEDKDISDVLYDASFEAKKIHDLAWAAESILLFNLDQGIDHLELISRASVIIDVIQTKAKELSEHLDKGAYDVNFKKQNQCDTCR